MPGSVHNAGRVRPSSVLLFAVLPQSSGWAGSAQSTPISLNSRIRSVDRRSTSLMPTMVRCTSGGESDTAIRDGSTSDGSGAVADRLDQRGERPGAGQRGEQGARPGRPGGPAGCPAGSPGPGTSRGAGSPGSCSRSVGYSSTARPRVPCTMISPRMKSSPHSVTATTTGGRVAQGDAAGRRCRRPRSAGSGTARPRARRPVGLGRRAGRVRRRPGLHHRVGQRVDQRAVEHRPAVQTAAAGPGGRGRSSASSRCQEPTAATPVTVADAAGARRRRAARLSAREPSAWKPTWHARPVCGGDRRPGRRARPASSTGGFSSSTSAPGAQRVGGDRAGGCAAACR